MMRFSMTATRLGGRLFAAAALLALLAGSAAAKPGKPGKPGTRSPFNLRAATTVLLSGNEWSCGLNNLGEICVNPAGSSVGGGGFWPQGTQNQYIFNTGLQLGAVIGSDGGTWAGDTVSDHFFDAYGSYATGVPLTNIYLSSSTDDLANWPADCYLTNPATGQRVKTLSSLDACVEYWDADPQKGLPGGHPMGIKVVQHSLEWAYSTNKDIIFFIFTFKNVTNEPGFVSRVPGAPANGFTLTNVYAAFGADPDVSAANASFNFGTVVPDKDMAVAWESDFDAPDFVPYAPNFDAAPGFFGVKFLKGPPNTADTAIIRRLGEVVDTVAPGEPMGMTFFSLNSRSDVMSDAVNASQSYRYLSGHLSADESSACGLNNGQTPVPGMCYVDMSAPADVRFLMSSGPFTLAPGDSAQIVVAYIVGAPVPGTYVKGTEIAIGDPRDTTRQIEKVMGRGYDQPGFPTVFAAAQNAQTIYDIGFLLPAAPPPPNVTVVPGDHQNTILWDATPVNSADPYYDIASKPELPDPQTGLMKPNTLYDPDYRQHDFEGFRVYRKANPADPWMPIAQFDLSDGIVEQVTNMTKVVTASGDTLIISADTASVCPKGTAAELGLGASFSGCTAETGLKFAVVDKGGSFPNSENGAGLVNGRKYYYAVTSFDINSPHSGPSSLESARVLSNDEAGIPRASVVDAGTTETIMTGASGTELEMGKSNPAVDPATGTLAGPLPPSNGFTLELGASVPQLLSQAATITAVLDSIVPGNPVMDEPAHYFVTVGSPATNTQYDIPVPVNYTMGSTGEEVVSQGFPALTTSAVGSVNSKKIPIPATLTIKVPDAYLSTVFGRSWVNGAGGVPWQGPRWFASGSTPPANPSAGLGYWWDETKAVPGGLLAGELPNTDIFPVFPYMNVPSSMRDLGASLAAVSRAADIEVTWGDNGAVTVQDLSNDVPIPFDSLYRASYGFLTPASFGGVTAANTGDGDNNLLTVSDWQCVRPWNQVDVEENTYFPDCPDPTGAALQANAQLMAIDTSYAGGGTARQGFAMYISGYMFFFFPQDGQLPASGTKWTLRTFDGWLDASIDTSDAGVPTGVSGYSWSKQIARPPVPGLALKVTVTPTSLASATYTLDKIHTVPDPYMVTNPNESNALQKQLRFVNLPPKAIIRIYSLSGTLIQVLTHDDPTGGGEETWDLRTRNSQYVASGVYFYHVEAPDGKTRVGKFTVIQYAQ